MLLSNLEIDGALRNRVWFLSSSFSVPLAILVCLILQRLQSEVFDFTGLALVFGALTWFLLLNKRWWLSVLDSRFFYVISRLSYGMYLNHEYMHEWATRVMLRWIPLAKSLPALHETITIALFASLSAGVSLVTFCAIESPFLHLRDSLLAKQNKKVEREIGVLPPL
jgi:peptidoglycan/LPS O-acetylase OafA/YrhL